MNKKDTNLVTRNLISDENVSHVSKEFDERLNINSAKDELSEGKIASENLDFPIDINFLKSLDEQTMKISNELVTLNDTLKTDLEQISKSAQDSCSVYRSGALDACDSIDSSIKTMYSLMAKCEELGKAMEPAAYLAKEAKEIRRLLDICDIRINQNTQSINASEHSTSKVDLTKSIIPLDKNENVFPATELKNQEKPIHSTTSSIIHNPCPTFMLPINQQVPISDNNSD